nr:MAG TPA: hypothetical protein [Caudoviricetes sp.]
MLCLSFDKCVPAERSGLFVFPCIYYILFVFLRKIKIWPIFTI